MECRAELIVVGNPDLTIPCIDASISMESPPGAEGTPDHDMQIAMAECYINPEKIPQSTIKLLWKGSLATGKVAGGTGFKVRFKYGDSADEVIAAFKFKGWINRFVKEYH